MAFASFGIITPVLSVVLSVFMLGLAVGAWAGGRFIASLVEKTGLSAVAFYAGAELLIGLGAFAVSKLFALGESVLLATGQTNSFGYLSLSALVLAFSILPWCVCMGATFPLMMAYVRERDSQNAESFSFLYLANVLGAMTGTIYTAVVLVEVLGFRHTVWVAAAGNFTIAFIGGCLAWERHRTVMVSEKTGRPVETAKPSPAGVSPGRLVKTILFSTGFIAMGMEVVWTRTFAPVLKTEVYSFAMIVFTYLGATFLGSLMYRRHLWNNRVYSTAGLIAFLAIASCVPVMVNDVQLYSRVFRSHYFAFVILLLASICPFCATLGYLTPRLVDEYAGGHPAVAGKAYAVNVLGCILGPIFASYVLLPWIREKYVLILLGLPFFVFYFICGKTPARWPRLALGVFAGVVLVWSLFFVCDFEHYVTGTEKGEVRRDYAASVAAYGKDRDKRLFVNGVGMTALTPVTKFMVHLPLAFHKGQPESALILCFGMGTTYRSALSWDLETTAVELVPSVTRMFGFYHADAMRVLNNPKGHIVIDDGRRYLKRTHEKFDVIVIDPPPPVEAAGSSLLYSGEFYELARQHLKPHGILQAWFPGGEVNTFYAVLRSIHDAFPYVCCFDSVERRGTHLLASMEPIEMQTAEQLAGRMPAAAKKDLLEWSPSENLPAYIQRVLSQETPIEEILSPNLKIRITDDQPYNEYYLLRRLGLMAY